MTAQPDPKLIHNITAVSLEDDRIILRWSDNSEQRLHPAYLRHSPGYPGGERPAGEKGRFPQSPAGFAPRQTELTESGDLLLTWQPGNVKSLHQSEWLRNHCGPEIRQQQSANISQWDATSINGLAGLDFNALTDADSTRLKLFEQILNWGVALIHDVPLEIDTVESVAKWFGQTPPNPYADDPTRPALSSIRVNPEVPVATHMSHFLGPHTDTCWRQTLIGLLLMHCLKAQPEGGRSMLVDGFTVANRLRKSSTEAFELLSSIPLSFGAKVAERDDWRVMGRVISVAADGVVEGIRYNGNSIGQLDLPDRLIAPMYDALEAFEKILYDSDLWWQPMLQPGDLLVIDNHRVLHGREAFDPSAGERHLQCCNVDRDDFHNNYRRLAKSMGSEKWDRRLRAGVV
jgi:gamma-butyrobetaine dioxygenase